MMYSVVKQFSFKTIRFLSRLKKRRYKIETKNRTWTTIYERGENEWIFNEAGKLLRIDSRSNDNVRINDNDKKRVALW